MSVRLSIGASRSRLIQQMLIESGLLAAVAGVLGLLFARVAGPSIIEMLAPSTNPVYLELRTDWRLLAFLCIAGTLTTDSLRTRTGAPCVAGCANRRSPGRRVSGHVSKRAAEAARCRSGQLQSGHSVCCRFVVAVVRTAGEHGRRLCHGWCLTGQTRVARSPGSRHRAISRAPAARTCSQRTGRRQRKSFGVAAVQPGWVDLPRPRSRTRVRHILSASHAGVSRFLRYDAHTPHGGA